MSEFSIELLKQRYKQQLDKYKEDAKKHSEYRDLLIDVATHLNKILIELNSENKHG